ncbi:MAG: hypothetical protein ABL930_06010 [Pseudobdellovibrio sp.]
MKLNSLILVAALALTACQKKSDDPNAKAKPSDKATPVAGSTKTSKMECTSKEVIKYISAKDGSVTRETYEESMKSISVSALTNKNGNEKSYNISGELVVEGFTTDNEGVRKQTTKIDYTQSGTRVSSTTKIDDKTTSQLIKRDLTKKGRNGYQFTNPDKTKSDTRKETSVVESTFFDDGETFYFIKYEGTINGKKGNYVGVLDTIQRYKTEGNVTKSVTTLKEPRVVKNADGVVIEETESSEENCTETQI